MKQRYNELIQFTQALETLCERNIRRSFKYFAPDRVHTPRVKLTRVEDAHTDADGFSYPERIDLKIENWNNHWYSFRLADGRLIREGVNLNSQGISRFTLLKRMVREHRAWISRVKLSQEARETNCIVHQDTLVVVENMDAQDFLGREGLFSLIYDDGSERQWYGMSPEDALNNAAPFSRGVPVMVRFVS